jgi:ABC-2 type transport system ATP-binding protein
MQTTADHPPIEVRGLSKTYRLGFWMSRRVQALKSLDLTVNAGQVYGLLGPNGAGKSTTIKVLMNLVKASSGQARLFGLPPDFKEARRQIGFVPENPSPYEYLTGKEFLKLSGQLSGLSGQTLDKRVKEVLSVVGMERAAGLQIRRYSKGMIQRIALAQAIIHKPKLLILDEPTSGLDPVGRRQMRDLILAEREQGTTVLFCTHIIPDVETLCDRVAVLVGGNRVREGSVKDLLTADAPLFETVLEGVALSQVHAWGYQPKYSKEIGERLIVRTSDQEAQSLARKVLGLSGRIIQLQPVRFSLEDLFLQTLTEVKESVGTEIT